MIKKVTTFLSTGVRQCIDNDPAFSQSPAFTAALMFPTRLIGWLTADTMRDMRFRDLGWLESVAGAARTYITHGHPKRDKLQNVFTASSRMEARVQLVNNSSHLLRVCVELFRSDSDNRCRTDYYLICDFAPTMGLIVNAIHDGGENGS